MNPLLLFIAISSGLSGVKPFSYNKIVKTETRKTSAKPTLIGSTLSSSLLQEHPPEWSSRPTLSNILLQYLLEEEKESDDDLFAPSSPFQLQTVSDGLDIWNTVLKRGRLPVIDDFTPTQQIWPEEPLYTAISDAMIELELPRFILRYPETVSSVLLSVIRIVTKYNNKVNQFVGVAENDNHGDGDGDGDGDDSDDYQYEIFEQQVNDNFDTESTFFFDEKLFADDLAASLKEEYGGLVFGVNTLNKVFGFKDISDIGYGLQDGIWQHSGWTNLNELQRQISSMKELKELMKTLGRRPTAQGNSLQNFAPRKLSSDGSLGAQYDPSQKTSIRGLTLSSSLAEMLPSEAVLLKGSPSLRRLFFAKKIESKLLSYELSGYTDVPSLPKVKPRYLSRMPSASGGPIVVCLDTSYSMCGQREKISKSVVLSCVSLAHKQGRDCHVVAFSNKNGVMGIDQLSGDRDGVSKLLDFLGYSFGGGTDVTGALKHAMSTIGGSFSGGSIMGAADLLLVTDGEIPDPPVPDDIMKELERLKQRTGLEIHGLLVGKSESKALSKICTRTHNFLSKYDNILGQVSTNGSPINTSPTALPCYYNPIVSTQHGRGLQRSPYNGFMTRNQVLKRKRRDIPLLRAKSYSDDEWGGRRGRQRKGGSKRRRFDDDLDELWEDEYSLNSYESKEQEQTSNNDQQSLGIEQSFKSRLDKAVDNMVTSVKAKLKDEEWRASDLDREKARDGSCWQYHAELMAAVDRVAENLVERGEEARLVVLGMVAGEHVLLLGPPGTGKSALGRRLAMLSGGLYFQRLLTRFTTTEEIFGPLSLSALENDEYRRCTTGFLPTASVAFLDEIFKANSAILNTLLTILNERHFDNGAGIREDCPIRCVVGASNELPESDELDALYDRFLLRKEVLPVSDEGLMQMLSMTSPGESPCDDVSDIGTNGGCETVFYDGIDSVVEALSKAINHVSMGNDACALLRDLRLYLKEELEIDVSDRRLVKAARLLKISAASHGRKSVDPIDCLLLQHMTWRLPEQRIQIREWLWNHITPGSAGNDISESGSTVQFRFLLNGLRRQAIEAVRKTSGDLTGSAGALERDVAVVKVLRTETKNLGNCLQRSSASLARHIELLKRSKDYMWLDQDETRAVQQILLPKAEIALDQVNEALADARALELVLSDNDKASPSNELRLSVLELLWEDTAANDPIFNAEELGMSLKEAKAKYDSDTLRSWKRERKRAKK